MGSTERAELVSFIEKEVLFVSKDSAAQTYRVLKLLGEGSFGFVCAAERRKDGVKVALKTLKFRRWTLSICLFETELSVCRDLSTPACENVVQCLDVVELLHPYLHVTGMVMELCHIDLRVFWRTEWRKRRMTSNVVTMILQQIWIGLADVHRKGYAHGDTKSSNILIDASTGTMKLADFGVASKIEEHNMRNEDKVRRDVTKLARTLSELVSNSTAETTDYIRLAKCVLVFRHDPAFSQHPEDVQEILPYIFTFPPPKRISWTWWDERVAEAPHLQEIAVKAIQWMHTNPGRGDIALPLHVATTFVRGFGFQGCDAINASGMADDISRLTTADMKAECAKYFQDFLRDELSQGCIL